MVVEQFLEKKSVKQHAIFLFLLGFTYVIIGYFVGKYFFPDDLSVAVLFTVTLLLLPSIYVIINLEEKVESRMGLKHFYNNHKDIFKIILFVFLGVFAAYVILGSTTDLNNTFSYQINFLEARNSMSAEMIQNFKVSEYDAGFDKVFSLISNNLIVILIAFLLSVFYGAGALFLIVLNASMFAAFISFVMEYVANEVGVLSVFLIHMIPELAGFTLAAIAGSVISRALVSEKIGSRGFKNVLRDSLVLLCMSLVLIVFSAILEVFVSANLIKLVL